MAWRAYDYQTCHAQPAVDPGQSMGDAMTRITESVVEEAALLSKLVSGDLRDQDAKQQMKART
ncbi:MAG: hypothetical protein OXB94_14020 [Nitrospira sp.]|nr:hypothetical protein [Nitrospira sp.]